MQVTNLDRFELFFPEKRQFYLENSDLFANLGSDNVRPFFSRRIGLDSPVMAGASLSGKSVTNGESDVWIFKLIRNDTVNAENFTVAVLAASGIQPFKYYSIFCKQTGYEYQ